MELTTVGMAVTMALGIGTAFVGSMPIAGPLAVLVLQRALAGHRLSAGLAAAGGGLVEGAYALVIGLGLPPLMRSVDVVVPLSQGLGSVVITTVGTLLWFRPQTFETSGAPGKRMSLLSGVVVTAINPTLLASWTLVMSTLYAHGWITLSPASALPFAVGVTIGTTVWFVLLILLTFRFNMKLNSAHRRKLTRVLGGALVCVGIYLALRFFGVFGRM